MSNWAKLQEDMTGLPVAKRAKHAIHFQNSDGSITANFSGKPCHFQDTDGLWKPIDTKLLTLPDGWLGCAHSKVNVHTDGRVRIAGTDYLQRVELPTAQTGLVDGDKIVRKFSFGEQRMWVTEDGFRSEIQLNRIPTLTEARKLIATESGTLSKEYLKSLTVATDSSGDILTGGNVHTITTLTAFRTWLASAKFPITIDPDLVIRPDESAGMDTHIKSSAATTNYANETTMELASWLIGNTSDILIKFDLSSLPAGATVSSSILSLEKAPGGDYSISTTIYRLLLLWVEAQATWNIYSTGNNWNTAGAKGSGTDRAADATQTGVTTGDPMQYTVTDDVQLFANGTSNYGWIIECPSKDAYAYRYYHSSGATSEADRPVLTVTYTASGIAIPVAQYYYNRLRRN